ncbi:glutamate--tRNA ligase [Candidatus Uhrbacteria bacterium]|nr:glutamate--tRNA ligase [Candidatus Uhrbacteria bacterium]
MSVRVRFAPSPTGFLHIGGLRSALYNWLFARRHGGVFALRIEDTDRSRFVEGAIENLQRSLEACGLKPDEGPFIQSERREKHLQYAYDLIEKDKAYYCFCTKERLDEVAKQQQALKHPIMYDRHCRNLSKTDAENRAAVGDEHVIRLKVPTEGSIKMRDMIRGDVEIPWAQVDDQVIIKSDGYPTYHLAATCDDHDMAISHVIRGEEWLSSLPKHLFIFESFGWQAPQYAHLPLLLNPDRSKLSKRQGDVAVEDYLAKGYLPEALVNFVALLGWNPTSDREIFTKEELAELFDITKVNKAGAVFNTEKLNWLNAHYLKSLDESVYLLKARELGFLDEDVVRMRAAIIARERITVLSELPALIEEATTVSDYSADMLVWKKSDASTAKTRLKSVRDYIAEKDEDWFGKPLAMEEETRTWIAGQGFSNGDTLWPLRVALSGREKSPSPFELMFVAGKDESLSRIDAALEKMA